MHGTSLAPLEAGQAGIARKLLAFLLSAVLALSLTPTYAFAEGDATGLDALDADGSFVQADAASSQVEDAPSAQGDSSSSSPEAEKTRGDALAGASSAAEQARSGDESSRAAASSSAGASDAPQARVDAAVAALDGLSFYKVKPRYGIDSNINDVLEEKLAELGYADIDVRTAEAAPSQTDPAFTAAISDASDDTNGAITYASYDPGAFSSWALASYRSFSLEFVLAYNGAEAHWKQSGNTVLDWDEHACERLLEPYGEGVAVGFAAGDSADAVTADMTLPYKAKSSDGSVLSWSSVVWESSDDSLVEISGGGYQDYRAKVVRGASDAQVTLTAKVSIVTSGGPQAFVERTFPITVKGDLAAVEGEKQELSRKLDAAFSADALTYSEDGAVADASALTGDIQLPTPRAIGVDGKYYAVAYTADSDVVTVNGYRGTVYRGLPGSAPAAVKLTATVTDKSNPAISVEKTIEAAAAPLEAEEIDAEVALMDAAVKGYAEAIADGQRPNAVTGDLHAFRKAYRASDGSLAWSYDVNDAVADGISPVELPGASETAGYRLIKSSVPSVVKHENLVVTRPAYDTKVTVSARLSSEKFARYAERYASDSAWGAKFAQLAARDVSAEFTVLGTSGAAAPKVSATLSVIGMDAQGAAQTWVAADTYTLDNGATAADLSEAAFSAAGLAADYGTGQYGWYLNTITSPFDGRVLGWDSATGKFWQLFVNGKPADVGASGVVLAPGDSVVWSYSASGEMPPAEEISVSGEVYGKNAAGEREIWADSTQITLERGATAADLSDALFAKAGLAADTGTGQYGWYLNTITSPFDGRVLGWNEATGDYWQLFVNGEYSQVGAGSAVLEPDDTVTWVYGSDGVMPPDSGSGDGDGGVVANPDAPHPDVDSSWPGYMAGNAAIDIPEGSAGTATQQAQESWQADFSQDGGNLSEPIVVDGKIFVAAGSALYAKDAKTGETLHATPLAAPIDSVARMVYAQGMVIVPLSGGRLQAVAATGETGKALATVWLTEKLPAATNGWGDEIAQQSLTTLTVDGGVLYYGTADGDAPNTGYLLCIDIATGAVVWKNASPDAGYYWSGAGVAGDFIVMGDDAGDVKAIDKADGSVVSVLHVSDASIRSTTVIADEGRTAYIVSRDGVLHKVSIAADGALSESARVKFASSSTSTPTLSGGKLFVGGQSEQYDQVGPYMKYRYGSLSVIDAETLSIEREVVSTTDGKHIGGADGSGGGAMGDVKSMPLVVNQAGETYVYFTSNMKPGGAYCYRLGDEAASSLYEPAPGKREYTMSSLVAGPDGMLYFINDSNTLFALAGGDRPPAGPDAGPDSEQGAGGDGQGGSHAQSGAAGYAPAASTAASAFARSSALGAAAPAKRPVGDARDAKADAGEDASAASASADAVGAVAFSKAADAGDASPARSADAGAPAERALPIAALVGMAVGVCGLLAAIAWAYVLHRRKRG